MEGKLYKYRSLETIYNNKGDIVYNGVERCVDIIKNNRLYFPLREKLNDPYEGIATPVELCVIGMDIYESMGLLHPSIEDRMNQYRILSLSGDNSSMQMWAHYAANYMGICFEFGTNGILGTASKVTYIEKPFAPVVEPDDEELERIIRNNFFYKSIKWEYEDEYRIVDLSNKEFIEFDSTELEGIIIGSGVLKNKAVKEEIITLAKKRKIPVYYTFFTPLEYKLSIVTEEDALDLGIRELGDILYI